MNRRSLVASIVGGLALLAPGTFPSRAQAPVSFIKDIQPIFENSCWGCHSGEIQSSRLDLSTRQSAIKGGDRGTALVPGRAQDSRLYRLVAGLDKPPMPLGGQLTPAQIAMLKEWIDQGAPWDAAPPATGAVTTAGGVSKTIAALENFQLPKGARDYWAFKLPVQAPLPEVAGDHTNPIDRFLAKKREEKHLRAAPQADALTLVRRAYLDLTGLPPTPAEAAAYVADKSPGAWSKLIDQLLASPRYGERWGRHWLDVARYADSNGYELDFDKPNAWRYRDYVIDAFNHDKPFDAFLKEQISGDELPDRTQETYIATGFLRSGPRAAYREKDNPERRLDYLDDMIGTIGRGVLGLTIQCARCHNHKFDPIGQKDYYALQASLYGYVETTYPLVAPAEAAAYQKKLDDIAASEEPLKAEIAKIEAPYREKLKRQAVTKYPENIQKAIAKPEAERTPGEQLLAVQVFDQINVNGRQIDQILPPEDAQKKKAISDQIKQIESGRPKPLPIAEIVTDGDHRRAPFVSGDDTIGCPKCRIIPEDAGPFVTTGSEKYRIPASYFLVGGDPNTHGSAMKPGFLTVATYGNPPVELPPADGHTSGRRRALGEWLASRDNPLTARVFVNRIWQHHFGRGIVPSLDNFGKMGELPTNQELLDWLAVEFMNRGWSVKQMQKLMMTSEAYQMASSFEDATSAENDPQDQYLWHFLPQRLDSEVIRDSMLAASGAINLAMGGPPVRPPLPKEFVELRSAQQNPWKNQEDGANVWRRSVYVYAKRAQMFPMFEVFDRPDANFTVGARDVSTVATQALTLLNDDFVVRQAGLFAQRVTETAGPDPGKQIDLAYRIALARGPSAREASIAMDLVKAQTLVGLTNVLLNLNEFLYQR